MEEDRGDCCLVYFVYIIFMLFFFGLLPIITGEQFDSEENSIRPRYKIKQQLSNHFSFEQNLNMNNSNLVNQTFAKSKATRLGFISFQFSLLYPTHALGDIKIGPETLFPKEVFEKVYEWQILLSLICVALFLFVTGLCVIKNCCH